ncbi:MAG TPA: TIGR01244 family sulfur transferase [Dyella sp.]|nr:TIGR01244 family sulfur transferase [Dyella sp.]
MDIRPLTDTLSVSLQIAPSELATLAAQGFRTVINNRPDGEEPGQPDSATMARTAAAAGLAYRHIPVVSGQLRDAQVDGFAEALSTLPGPILAYCRTGTRSSMLWALQAARSEPAAAVLERARRAGYDLSALAPRLEALRGA